MPLFTYPPSPLVIYTPGIENAVSTAAITAGSAYASLVQIAGPVTVTQMRCIMEGSPTGNIDMGIYDSTGSNGGPGNLLAHTGANTSATGLFTKSLTANVLLSPGNYWLAFLDTVADTPSVRQCNASGGGAMVKTTSTSLTVLPASFGALTDTTFLIAVLALVQNGYS